MNLIRLFTVFLIGLLFAGCASWPPPELAGKLPGKRDRFEGFWEGRWESSRRANSGDRLQCRLQKVESGLYRADFRAFWHGLSGAYPVDLITHQEGGCLYFEGTHQLPKIQGGLYRYEGFIAGDELRAWYNSKYDTGEFRLKRAMEPTGGH
jgi:hypothetical protein